MNAEQLWGEFCSKKGIDNNTPYATWAFHGDEDEQVKLVLEGKKFGRSSLYAAYEAEGADAGIPKVGDYSIILDNNEKALCVIRSYDVYIRPFKEVPPFHAYSEGEGDRSLECWRNVRRGLFEKKAAECGISFSEDSKIICEKFSLEYVSGQKDANFEDNRYKDELLFIEPTMNYAGEITAYRQEMIDAQSSFDGCFSMKRMPDPQEYIDYCIGWSNPSRIIDEHGARGNVLLVIRKNDMKMIGCMQVHNVLTQTMKDFTGHVGYSVRPSERRKGYAKRMLAKALDFLKAFEFEEINVSCLPENIASKKTIISNGGEYVETVFLESDQVYLEKYRISLM